MQGYTYVFIQHTCMNRLHNNVPALKSLRTKEVKWSWLVENSRYRSFFLRFNSVILIN